MSQRALPGLLVLSVLGEGGATPLALFAAHLALVLLFLRILARRERAEPRRELASVPLGAWAIFLALVAAEALVAPYGYAAFLVLVELAASLAVAVLAARAGPALVERLGAVIVWGGAAQGILAGYQRFVGGEPRPAGTFLNPNHLGAWLVVAVVLGLSTTLFEKPKGARLLLRCAALLAAAGGLLLCASRGALLALAAAALFFGVVAGRGMDRGRRALVLGAASVLLVAASIGIAVRVARSPDPFAYHRLRIWKASLGAVAAAPWTGPGPGQFKTVAANLNFPLEEGALRYERFFVSPHSDFLRVPCELGWPATVVFLAALALVAVEIVRRMRSRALPASSLAAQTALVALAAQAVVDDLTDRPALYLLASALLGSLLSTPRATALPPGLGRVGLRAAAAGLLVAAFAVGEVAPLLALEEVSPSLVRGASASSRDLPRGRLDAAQHARLLRALKRNPLHPDAWLREAEHLAGDGSDWSPESYASAREAAERALRLQPEDARYRLGLARIERLACTTLFRDEASRERTARAYEKAREKARHDPFIPLEQGRFLLATGDPSGARRAAERALAIEPRAIPPRLLLAEALLASGEERAEERARDLVAEAEEIAAKWKSMPKQTPYARALLELPVDSAAPSP